MRIMSMIWMKRTLSCAVFAALTLGAASSAGQNCVELCQAKANSCAEECSEKSGESFDACQLGCAKLFYARCVQQCSDTGVVVWDDYEVRTLEESDE